MTKDQGQNGMNDVPLANRHGYGVEDSSDEEHEAEEEAKKNKKPEKKIWINPKTGEESDKPWPGQEEEHHGEGGPPEHSDNKAKDEADAKDAEEGKPPKDMPPKKEEKKDGKKAEAKQEKKEEKKEETKEEKKEDFVPPELQGAMAERKFTSFNDNAAFSIESNSLWEEPAIQARAAPKRTAPVEKPAYSPSKGESEFDEQGMYIGRTVAVTSDGQNYEADIDDHNQIAAWNEKIKYTPSAEEPV